MMESMTVELETKRLWLLSFSPAILLAMIEGPREFEREMGMPIAAGLRDVIVPHVSAAWIEQLHAAGSADPWVHGFAVVERNDRYVIGTAGFKGPPDKEGMVEIGYGIAPSYQEHGYATEATEALIAFALAQNSVSLIRAHTLPSPNASTHVLSRCGFTYVGAIDDPEDGQVWRWDLPRKN
jgi:[ribosomal protein S5]-alanine N-acetyltransferase